MLSDWFQTKNPHHQLQSEGDIPPISDTKAPHWLQLTVSSILSFKQATSVAFIAVWFSPKTTSAHSTTPSPKSIMTLTIVSEFSSEMAEGLNAPRTTPNRRIDTNIVLYFTQPP
jgi:hypothetical protein